MIIAILAGRKGSRGFPKKNLYEILERPLAHYPMIAAKECPEVDKVYLSTDDEELMRLAEKVGVEIIRRPAELCTDGALSGDVYVHAYNYIKGKNRKDKVKMVVVLMCNAATITSETISKGIKVLRERPEYDSAVTVSKYNMWSPLRARRIDKNGLLEPFVSPKAFGDSKALNCDRDSQGDVWFADMGVSVIRPRCLENIEKGLLPQKWMGRKIYPLKQWGGCDVDFEWQVPQVEYWLRKHGFPERCGILKNKETIELKPSIEALNRPQRQQPERVGKMKLDKNENIAGLDMRILKKVLSGLDPDFIASYPEIGALYKKLSIYLGCKEENLVVTFGSDGAIRSVFEAFVNPGDEVITLNPTYAMYDVYCDMFGARKISIDFDKKLCLSARKIRDSISDKTRLIALPNPNSPTGTVIGREDLINIVETASHRGVIVLIDEAYHGFYKETMLPYIKKYKNLIVTRTFSKTGGIASLRIGYAVGCASIIEPLYKVKPMYETNGIAVRFAEYILEHKSVMERYVADVRKGKLYLVDELEGLGLKVFPGYANFVVVEMPGTNNKIADMLASKNVLIKSGHPHPSMKDTIRITVGPRKDMAKFMKIFKVCFEELTR